MGFRPIDFNEYNFPPYFLQWLSSGETLKLATFDDGELSVLNTEITKLSQLTDLDNVQGWLLDRIGHLLSEERNGDCDETYRLRIKLRIVLNTTDGAINDVIKVVKAIYTSEEVHITPNYPAGITILHDGEGGDIDFNSIISQVVGVGISYNTKENFNFVEDLPTEEEPLITVTRDLYDTYPSGARHNHRLLRDQAVRNRHNGVERRNGAITRNGWKAITGTIFDTIWERLLRSGEFRRNNEVVRTGFQTLPAIDVLDLPVLRRGAISDVFTLVLGVDDMVDATSLQDDGIELEITRHFNHDGRYRRQADLRNGIYIRNGARRHFEGRYRSGNTVVTEVV